MAGKDTSQPPPPPIVSTEAPQMLSSVKLPILKKGEYILWTMKIEQYLAHTDYNLWEVILNGNSAVQMIKDEADEHLVRFHRIKDAKTLWAAIKTRFGVGQDKGYDRFQRLLSLLKFHEAGVSTKVSNQKFQRSLPSARSNISLIMRNKPGIDNLDIDDMYNNLKVYDADIKGSSGSSSNLQDVAFVSTESTSSTNELNAAYRVSTATGHSSQAQGSSSYADELMFSFFANQSSSPQLDNKDLKKIDQDDLEKIDLKWQVTMLSIRVKRFYKKTGRKIEFNGKEPVGFDKTKVECFNCHKRGNFAMDCRSARNSRNRSSDIGNAGYKGRDNGKSPAKEEDEKALVVQDGLGTYDWSYQVEEEATDFALMAFTSNPSSSSSLNSKGHSQQALKNKGIVDSGCSTHMTGNKAYLADYQEINDRGFVAFGSSRGKITNKGKIRTEKLDFDDVYYVNELHFNLFSVSQMCDKKNNVQFTETECLILRMKSIKREYSNAKTPQQNGVAERKNRTLIKAVRTMLADSLLPITLWAEVVNNACCVLNRALVTKSHNKTPYELLNGRTPRLDFMRCFGCPVTILNTLDPLGKFKGKADEGFLVGYYVTSKAFRVFNTKTKKVKENLHVRFLENKPNVAGTGPNWLFDIDSLTNSMNYIPVSVGNQIDINAGPQDTNGNAGTQDNVDVGKEVSDQHYIVLPLLMSQEKEATDATDALRKEFEQGCMDQKGDTKASSTNSFNTISNPVNAASTSGTFSAGGPSSPHPDAFIPANTLLHVDQDDSQIPNLEDTAELRKADFNNIDSSNVVSLIPTHKVHIDHPKDQILRDPKIEAIRIFLAFASFMRFIVYQMDVKSAFLYDIIEEEVYVSQPSSFIDPQFPNKVYKVEKALYGLHQAPRAWYETLSTFLLQNGYRRGTIDKTLFIKKDKVKQSEEGIFITQKPLVKDKEAVDVDVHLYRSMIGSLMYLTASRPDIRFAVCACSRFQVTPKLSYLHDVKRIFRYLKGQPKLGIWYLRDSPFDLEAYSDSDYAGANLDRKSTTGCCQFLGRRLISWQCKKHTIVTTSTTEAEYIATFNCCGQVFDLENVKTAHTKEIASLKKRFTKLKQRQSSRISGSHPFRAGSSKRHDEDVDTEMIVEDKGNGKKGGSTAETVSTARPDISAARPLISTAKPKTPPTTATLFDDEDVTITDTLVKMKNQKAKEKGIAFKDVDDSARPIISITTLQPLPTIHSKDKGRFTHAQLKSKSFKEIQKLYIKEQNWVDAFVLIGSEEDKKRIGSRKKRAACSSSKYKSPKKQKVMYMITNLLDLMEVTDFSTFSRMLEVHDRQDVLNLYKIIMERFPANDPEGYDLILWGDLNTLVKSMSINMFVEKRLKKRKVFGYILLVIMKLILKKLYFHPVKIKFRGGLLGYMLFEPSSFDFEFLRSLSCIISLTLNHLDLAFLINLCS
nr:hypothetical protein [Tanacetum cinerariifolium]